MPWKFNGTLEDLKSLLSRLKFKGEWNENINTQTTQVQFRCKSGEVLNFYWGTDTILIQGYRRDMRFREIFPTIKKYLYYEDK